MKKTVCSDLVLSNDSPEKSPMAIWIDNAIDELPDTVSAGDAAKLHAVLIDAVKNLGYNV